MWLHTHTHTRMYVNTRCFFFLNTQTHSLATVSYPAIYGLEMEEVLCLVELSNTILSHIGLTSNASDKPIRFLSTESSPCPKITLLSVGSQKRRMVSRAVDSSLWHRQYAWERQIKPFGKTWFSSSFQTYTELMWHVFGVYVGSGAFIVTRIHICVRACDRRWKDSTADRAPTMTISLPHCSDRQ